MPNVTGKLADFGLVSLQPYAPVLTFTPSGPAVGTFPPNDFLLADRPLVVAVASDGSFTAALAQTDLMHPVVWYTVTIKWLDPVNGFTSLDAPSTWQLFVPAAGGTITNLISAPWNPTLAWYGPTGSEYPPGTPVPSTLTLNTTTGQLYQWSN